MQYEKVKDELQHGQGINISEIETGADIFRLFRDQYLRFITEGNGCEYEMVIEEAQFSKRIIKNINNNSCVTHKDFFQYFKEIREHQDDIQIVLDGKIYDIIVETMVSNE